MRSKRLGIVLISVFIGAATCALGCLDSGGGNQDQWMNTDAYVGPEVGTSDNDGGVTCGDAPAFGASTRLSNDVEPDGGVVHVQYNVAMSGAGGDAGAGGVNVAWIDRNLATPQNATLRAVRVPAGASSGDIVNLQAPTGCDLLVDPALAASASGTVLLVATCVTGTASKPTETRILVFRSADGLASLDTPVTAVDCRGDTLTCGLPSVAATTGSVLLAWTEWTIDSGSGSVTGEAVKVWRSDDDGLTLAQEITLPAAFAASSAPRLAVGPGDDVHLAYTGALTLGGTTYAAHAALATETAFGTPDVLGPGSGPRLTVSADGAYVVYTAGTAVLEEAHDTGSGFTPGPLTQPAGTTAILSPSLAADASGDIHLFWLAKSSSGWSGYYSVSKDLGVGWSEALLISGPFDGDPAGSDMPHWIGAVDLVAGPSGVTLGWGDTAATDTMTGVTNVYLAQRVCP